MQGVKSLYLIIGFSKNSLNNTSFYNLYFNLKLILFKNVKNITKLIKTNQNYYQEFLHQRERRRLLLSAVHTKVKVFFCEKMRIKQICSFLLVYFVAFGAVDCDELPKPVSIPELPVNPNATSLHQNISTPITSSSTITTIAPSIQSSTKGKIVPKKEALEKPTTAIPITSTTLKPLTNTTTPTKQNVTTSIPKFIETEGGKIQINNNSTLNSTSSTKATSTSLTTAPSTVPSSPSTSTTTTKPTTTTTPSPKKPTRTFSDDDQPDIVSNEKSSGDTPVEVTNAHDVEVPNVLPSKEQFNPHRDFVVPLVTLIFALPIFLGIAVIGYRKVRDYWSTRHYRRMDFLVDGMYND